MDTFVKPRKPVTDYRTAVSGVHPEDLKDGKIILSYCILICKMFNSKMADYITFSYVHITGASSRF